MRVHRDILVAVLILTAQLAVAVTTEADQDEPQFQADVYNELYEAHVKCDENLDQSRSEFIVEMFDRHRGNRVSKELLIKLLRHNIRIAREELSERLEERERYVSERVNELENHLEHGADSNDRFRERQEQLKSLDDKISTKRRYVEINLCVLSFLQ